VPVVAPRRPAVAVQRGQKNTTGPSTGRPRKRTRTKPKGSSAHKPGSGKGSKSGAAAQAATSAANNVAPPPFSLSGAGALAALAGLEGLASSQALSFYRIPLYLLPIYKAAAVQYGIPWQFLAAINEIETDYGNDLSVSTAGAVGWMQFMPATWLQYGVDALDAGYADPYNPVDAIFAAARYLRAAGAANDLRAAILAYNHSEEYVESVLLRAKLISTYPKPVIATLTGLVDGRMPVTGNQVSWEALPASPAPGTGATGSPGEAAGGQGGASGASQGASGASGVSAPTSSPPPPSAAAASGRSPSQGSGSPPLELVDVRSNPSASVVAVQDGRIVQMGHSRQLGKYVVLRDVYGDVFTYAGLGSIAGSYSPPKPAGSTGHSGAVEAASTRAPSPTRPASAGVQSPLTLSVKRPARPAKSAVAPKPSRPALPASSLQSLQAMLAAMSQPTAPGNSLQATLNSLSELFQPVLHVGRLGRGLVAKAKPNGQGLPLRRGSVVESGTVLGSVSVPSGARAGHLRFAIRPAGDSATIDPAPILASWTQLQSALHPQGAQASNPLLGATASDVFLLSKPALEGAVLSDPGVTIGACARRDVAAGSVDKRVLAVLAFLSRSALHPSVGALPCPHGGPAGTGATSAQDTIRAVAVSAIDGTPIAGHQGASTITDLAIRTLLTLPSEFVPSEITSLMRYPGSANTLAEAAYSNRIRLGFAPAPATRAGSPTATAPALPGAAGAASPSAGSPGSSVITANPLDAAQWNQLIKRVSELPTPTVATKPSPSAVADPKRP
jgi:hypothetical protein